MIKQLLPTQKGTEVYPQQTRIPARVRITNTGDPALLQRAYDRVSPYVQNFYARCAREYSLGILRVARRQISVPGAEITYRNNHGEEIVSVALSPEIIKPDDEKSPTVLVIRAKTATLDVPYMSDFYADTAIVATNPALGDGNFMTGYNDLTYPTMAPHEEFFFKTSVVTDQGQDVHLLFVDLRQLARYVGDYIPLSIYVWAWWSGYGVGPDIAYPLMRHSLQKDSDIQTVSYAVGYADASLMRDFNWELQNLLDAGYTYRPGYPKEEDTYAGTNYIQSDMNISVEAYSDIDTDEFWDAVKQNPGDYPSKYQLSFAWYAYMVEQMEATGQMQMGQPLSIDTRDHATRIWSPAKAHIVEQSDYMGLRLDIQTGADLGSKTSVSTTYKGPFHPYEYIEGTTPVTDGYEFVGYERF